MSAIQFGTDGWRARVAEDFTFPNVRAVAQATAQYLKAHPVRGRARSVLVGYDTRPLGDAFAKSVSQVLAGNGLRVYLTRTPVPTPAISFAVRELKLLGAVAITASHNPFTYNGFKLKPFYAGPAEPAMTRWVEQRLFKTPVRQISWEAGLRTRRIVWMDLKSRYLRFLRGYVRWDLLRRLRVRIAYDAMHGAGQGLLEALCAETPMQILPVRPPPWPVESVHRPEPVGEQLTLLSRFVRSHRCQMGLATDGDADRVGVVGPDGRFISSQETMSLLLWHLLEDRGLRGMVVTTVAGTTAMERIASAYGVALRRTPVGFKHIARLMREQEVLFGGEESGGFGFQGCVPERDGILAGLLILEMMAMRRKSLGAILRDLRARFGRTAYARFDLSLARPLAPARISRWASRLAVGSRGFGIASRVAQIQTVDGVKILFEEGSWLLLRPSGTEPLLRIYAEAPTAARVKALLKAGQRIGRRLL